MECVAIVVNGVAGTHASTCSRTARQEQEDCTGAVQFCDLAVPPEVYASVPGDCSRLELEALLERLPPRPATAHKGMYGTFIIDPDPQKHPEHEATAKSRLLGTPQNQEWQELIMVMNGFDTSFEV